MHCDMLRNCVTGWRFPQRFYWKKYTYHFFLATYRRKSGNQLFCLTIKNIWPWPCQWAMLTLCCVSAFGKWACGCDRGGWGICLFFFNFLDNVISIESIYDAMKQPWRACANFSISTTTIQIIANIKKKPPHAYPKADICIPYNIIT